MWIFSHTGINNVNIDIALEAKKRGMTVIAYGSAAQAKGKKTRHSCGKTIFDIADLVVDSCAPAGDASVPLKNNQDPVGPVSTMAFITCVWMTVCTVAEILDQRGVKFFIHPSHNVPGDTTAPERLADCQAEYRGLISAARFDMIPVDGLSGFPRGFLLKSRFFGKEMGREERIVGFLS